METPSFSSAACLNDAPADTLLSMGAFFITAPRTAGRLRPA